MFTGELAPINYLVKEFISKEEIKKTLYFDIEENSFKSYIDMYSRNFNKKYKENNLYSRYNIEFCLQYYKILPFSLASLRLGMSDDSFRNILQYLKDNSMLPFNSDTNFIPIDFLKNIHKYFNGLANKIFSSTDSFNKQLHDILSPLLPKPIASIYCTTSEKLNPDNKLLAYRHCCISKQPTSIKHSVPLNFKKPIALEPDYCSKLFYYKNKDELKQYLLGSDPDLSEFEDNG